MSKRRSRSAILIGKFEFLTKNKMGVEEHAQRWLGHYLRWLDQLERLLVKRSHVVARLRGVAGEEGSPETKSWAADCALVANLDRRARDLLDKLQSVGKKLASTGMFRLLTPHSARYRAVLTKVKDNWSREANAPWRTYQKSRVGHAESAPQRKRVRLIDTFPGCAPAVQDVKPETRPQPRPSASFQGRSVTGGAAWMRGREPWHCPRCSNWFEPSSFIHHVISRHPETAQEPWFTAIVAARSGRKAA